MKPPFKTTGILFVVIGVLVCCILMQMVGINHSLWNPTHVEDDFLESSITSASTLIADGLGTPILTTAKFEATFPSIPYQHPFATSIDRPPIFS